jgi:hypothetical protein
LQRLKVGLLVIGQALFPAGKQDADPLKGDGSHCGMIAFAPGALGFITGLRPGAEAKGGSAKLVEGLARETWDKPERNCTVTLLPLALRTGAIPLRLKSSEADSKRSRSVPKAVSSRGASAAPAPGRSRNRKLSGWESNSSAICFL